MNHLYRPSRLSPLLGALLLAAGSGALQAQTPSRNTDPNAVPSPSTAQGPGIGYGVAPPAPADTSLYPTTTAQASTGTTSGGTSSAASTSDSSYSLLPYTRRGYVGINLGRPSYSTDCGAGGLPCDDPNVAGRLSIGGLFNDHFGAELAYLHMGRADRAGGTTRAQGLNLSLLGRVPFGAFSAFAKGGITYGRTDVSVDPVSLLPTGGDSGWGRSYGVGLGWDVSRNSTVVLEWERHAFHFAGTGRQDVDATTLGYRFNF